MSEQKVYVTPSFEYWPAEELDKIEARMSGGFAGRGNPGTMAASDQLITFLANYETFSAVPYRGLDAQNLTIGYGHVIKSGESYTSITEAEAWNLLKGDVQEFQNYINQQAIVYRLYFKQHQFDALVSFTFNKGYRFNPDVYTPFRNIVDRDSDDIIFNEFLTWRTVNGQFSLGVYRRSYDEAQMYVYGDYNRDYVNAP